MHEFQARALAQKEARKLKRKATTWVRKETITLGWRTRSRAEKKGWDHDLTSEWLAEKAAVTHCEATGVRFEGNGREPFGKTIDRKDSTKGYTMDNCWVVCWLYNRAKLDGTHEDVLLMARALVEFQPFHHQI